MVTSTFWDPQDMKKDPSCERPFFPHSQSGYAVINAVIRIKKVRSKPDDCALGTVLLTGQALFVFALLTLSAGLRFFLIRQTLRSFP